MAAGHMMATELYSERVYAYALSKTLTKVHPPMTVGLYSSCHSRIRMILNNIKGHMNDEAQRREQEHKRKSKPRELKASIKKLFLLIIRLLFYRPVWTVENQNRECVRYVFVSFSAWHFTGSDMLWAGLVIHLCRTLQNTFGKLQLALYRVAQYNKREDATKKKIEESHRDWKPKKCCCCRLWICVLFTITGSLIILVGLCVFGFSKQRQEGGGKNDTSEHSSHGVVEGFFITILGIPAVAVLRFIFMLVKNLLFNQDFNIRSYIDNKKVSEQLGLMHEIRKEMRMLSLFIHFMEIFERRKIKVVLEITNLDRCTPEKIVGVLDAVNILLSDEESPFISLIAVDPEVLTQQVDQAQEWFSKENRAYSFLDRIITLPFTIPPLCDVSKRKVFRKIVCGQSEISADVQSDRALCSCESQTSLCVEEESSLIWGQARLNENVPETCAFQNDIFNEDEVEKLIQSGFESIFLRNESRLHTYISENTVSMRRVINSIRVTIAVMKALKIEVPSPERVSAWVVLVDRWPCRLSWILQCVEDEQQTLQTDQNDGLSADDDKTLWSVFSEHRVELHVIGEEVEKFLERDDDPELFKMFLKNDFIFTITEMNTFKLYTVNLDYSIKNELARIRGSKRVKGSGRSYFKSLSPKTVIRMTPTDVCNELSKLKLQKYTETVMENHINGQTLLLSDPADLRQVMKMTLGEWTTFRIHFLGVMSRGRLSQTKTPKATPKPSLVICPPGLTNKK